MSQHDAWKSTDKQAEVNEQLHATFDRSDEYMAAYVDYCDGFETSDAYDEAFDKFTSDDGSGFDEDDDPDAEHERLTEEFEQYYGLHAEDEHDHYGSEE